MSNFRSMKSLYAIFAAAAFASTRSVFGGIPLASLTNKARRKHHRGSINGTTDFSKRRTGLREQARHLAFKERHGHFA